MPKHLPTARWVPEVIIQTLFNQSPYPTLIADGQLLAEILYDQELPYPNALNEPTGTRSQVIRYFDRHDAWQVEAHRYLRPDGTLGASGLLDPKRIMLHGIEWVLQKKPHHKLRK